MKNHFVDTVIDELFYGTLPNWQKDPMDYIIEEGHRRNMSTEEVSYVLATAYHETNRFKAKEEYGQGRGRDYGTPILTIRGKYEKYHGRGWVQLTWLQNYAKMSVAASLAFNKNIDLVNEPEQILTDKALNAFICFEGMIQGTFTGRKLSDYVNSTKCDFIGARKVINGTDKAALIAGYAEKFKEALEGEY